MAIILPSLHSKNLRLTPGERRFGTALLRNLEDDYFCWVDVPVGPKQRRPDFVVLHPGRGILVLEAKDWKPNTIRKMTRHDAEIHTDRGWQTVPNPHEQAHAYAIEIKELLERDPLLVQQEEGRYKGKLLLPWGYGVVFTNISREEFASMQLDQAIPLDRALFKEDFAEGVDSESLQQKLWGMFTYSFGGVLSLARIDRVRWHLFPEIRIQQGSLFSAPEEQPDETQSIARLAPDIVKTMDMAQEVLARNLGEGHRVIHGVAGSGKTLILAYRALHLSQQGYAKPVLVLCFNTTLAARLKQMLADRGAGDDVHVYHFHDWCKQMCDHFQLDLPGDKSQKYFERQVAAVIAGCEQGRVERAQYSAVLIDEGHDFQPEWYKLLVQMIDPQTNSLLLMYDDAQNIYGGPKRRKFTWASVGVNAAGRTTILKVNYRNTVEVLDFAYRFVSGYIEQMSGSEDMPLVHPEVGGRSGPKPELLRFGDATQEHAHIVGWLKRRVQDGVHPHEMAVLCRYNSQVNKMRELLARNGFAIDAEDARKKSHGKAYDPASDSVKVLTMHSSKGLEFDSVVIPDLGCMPCAKSTPEEDARLLYVALTRSTAQLIVTCHNESEFTRQCEALGH